MNVQTIRSLLGFEPHRLRFLTFHLYDLQTLRWLGLHLALILSPAFFFLSFGQNCWLLGLIVIFTAGWFIAFTRTMRKRFGYARLTVAQRMRLRYPSGLIGFVSGGFFLAHLICRYVLKTHGDDFVFFWWLSAWMLPPLADDSNPKIRRIAYVLAATVLVGSYITIWALNWTHGWHGALAFSFIGAVFLGLALFDYVLLCKAAQGTVLQESWTA